VVSKVEEIKLKVGANSGEQCIKKNNDTEKYWSCTEPQRNKSAEKVQLNALLAANYLSEAKKEQWISSKLKWFLWNAGIILNSRATTQDHPYFTIPLTLPWKVINNKMIEAANVYMEKVGFGATAFSSFYKHEDAGYPLLFIYCVPPLKQMAAGLINTSQHRWKSIWKKARKEIEQQYGLIKAERQHN